MSRRGTLLAGVIEVIVLSLSGEVTPRRRRRSSCSFWLGGLALLLAGAATANALTFTPGDLVVSVEGNGDGSASGGTATTGNTGGSANTYLDNQAAPLSLYEFATTGAVQSPVGVLTLPQSQSGNNAPVSGEYGSSSEAQLQLSGDGRYLTIAGYAINAATYNSNFDQNGASLLATPTGTALAQSCNTSNASLCTGNPGVSPPQVQRVIATINANGVVDSSTTLGNVFNTNNPRSVYSLDGKSFYISGQGSGNANDNTGGVFYVPTLGPNANPTPITGTDATSTGNPPNNLGQDTRGVQIYNNTLYVSVDTKQGSNSARDFIGTLGAAGSPPTTLASGGNGPTPLTGFGATVRRRQGHRQSDDQHGREPERQPIQQHDDEQSQSDQSEFGGVLFRRAECPLRRRYRKPEERLQWRHLDLQDQYRRWRPAESGSIRSPTAAGPGASHTR